jgi:hypothetical protein
MLELCTEPGEIALAGNPPAWCRCPPWVRWSLFGGIAVVIRAKLKAAADAWFDTPMYVYLPVYTIVFTPIMIGLEELARYLGILAALDRFLFG